MFPYRSSQGQLRSAFLVGKPGQGLKRWPLESLELFGRPGTLRTALGIGQLVEMSSLVQRLVWSGFGFRPRWRSFYNAPVPNESCCSYRRSGTSTRRKWSREMKVHTGIARWLDITPGHHNLQHLQKAVLLGSARILRKVMSSSV